MAENKQYVTIQSENGSVMISEDVIATIVSHAIGEVDGICGLSVKPGSDIVDIIGKKIMLATAALKVAAVNVNVCGIVRQ